MRLSSPCLLSINKYFCPRGRAGAVFRAGIACSTVPAGRSCRKLFHAMGRHFPDELEFRRN